MPFGLSYLLSCIMILGMLTIYLNAITRSTKAAKVFGTVLVVEYAFIFILLCLNRFALLTGSLGIFLTLAIMMYFTIRLRVRNGELQINR